MNRIELDPIISMWISLLVMQIFNILFLIYQEIIILPFFFLTFIFWIGCCIFSVIEANNL